MGTFKLAAKTRTITGKKVKEIRKQGLLPAVLYGPGEPSQNISLELREFQKVYAKAGISSLVDLEVSDKKPVKILIHEPQIDPVSDIPLHVDFYKIRMDEKLTTEIPLKFIGESPAVKELEGNLIKNKEEIKIECLPADLISQFEVDISGLKTFEDIIRIKDLAIPSTLKVLENPEDTVVLVNPPRSEEELEAMETESAADTEKAAISDIESKAEAEKATKEAAKEGEEDAKGVTGDKVAAKATEAPKTETK